jgi:pimeloyl-ACP methyl ester carboxylesterase
MRDHPISHLVSSSNSSKNPASRHAEAAWSPSRRELLGASAALGLVVGLSPARAVDAKPTDALPVRRSHVQVNGASLYVIEQGQGPTVLFCHGFPDTAETWRSQMRAVAEAGYRAVALDMRGFGASYAPTEASLYTSLHIVGDLVGVLDALEIQSAVLVGHDWGADHAQRAMVMRPDRFRALVSLSIPFAPRGEINYWDQLQQQGLGDRYYAFEMMKLGADARFAPAAKTIPSILYWLSGSPPATTRWNPVDPSRHMLRPSPVAVPSWADPEYVSHTIRSFEKTGFRGGLNYYRALPTTFDLTPAFKHAVIRQPTLYILKLLRLRSFDRLSPAWLTRYGWRMWVIGSSTRPLAVSTLS